MKRNEGKYKVVSKLPKNAVLVKQYAESKNVGESAIYNQLRRGKADFEIIIYFERNFVVPIKLKQ